MEKSNLEVLVVGAGPTGLTLAADLLRRGIRVRIIDQASAPSDKSKALGVQAGTLEALASTLGPEISSKMVSIGQAAREATIHIDNLPEVTVDLSVIQSEFNYILILAQNKTEHLLGEEVKKYGGQIEWNTSLEDLRQTNDSVICQVSTPNGQTEIIEALYVVGCDGAHSKVRKLLNLPFQGGQYEGEFILGDVQIDWPYPKDSIHVFISDRGVMPCFPLDGNGLYRLIPIPKNVNPSVSREISFEEFRDMTSKIANTDLKISRADWLTRFRVHHRLSAKFSEGRAFLAGDAAHIHSPAGGQGMNIGIQDSLNLSHNLFAVLRNNKHPQILEQYERERMPIAKKVIRGTDIAFRGALLPDSSLARFLRKYVVYPLAKNRPIRNLVIEALSQVKVARREIRNRST